MEISFEEDNHPQPPATAGLKKTGPVTALFIKVGLAKDAKSATNIMVITVIALVVVMFIFFAFNGSQTPEPPPPEPIF